MGMESTRHLPAAPRVRRVVRASGATLVAMVLVAVPVSAGALGIEATIASTERTTSDPLVAPVTTTETTLLPDGLDDGVARDDAGVDAAAELAALIETLPLLGDPDGPAPAPTEPSRPPSSGGPPGDGQGVDRSGPDPVGTEAGPGSVASSPSGPVASRSTSGPGVADAEWPAPSPADTNATSNVDDQPSVAAPSSTPRRFSLPDRGLHPTGPPQSVSNIRSTTSVIELLRSLDVSPAVMAKVLSPFPLAGEATYSPDATRRDDGVELFSRPGTPVIASVAGVVSDLGTDRGSAGTSIHLLGRDGTEVRYAYLDRFADDLGEGDAVHKGQVIGFVGATGRAAGGPARLRFEIRKAGGATIDPIPLLDRWLADALTTARLLADAPAGTLAFERGAAADAAATVATAHKGAASAHTAGRFGRVVSAPIAWVTQPIAAFTDRAGGDWSLVTLLVLPLSALAWRIRRRVRGHRLRRPVVVESPLPLV